MGETTTSELTLGSEVDAVPQARRFTSGALAGIDAGTVADAELVVAELVTNALLHAGPPALLRIRRSAQSIRIEVEDAARQVPISPPLNTETMTGRGMSLVATLAGGWGVDPGEGGGKVVWAELTTAVAPATEDAAAPSARPEIDVDALLAAWADDEPREPLHTVRLGSVPTDLLLAAKAHIDNLVREFTLARAAGETTGEGLPAALERLVDTVTEGFASARAEIKRQAVAAAARGDAETDLLLTQPASAAEAGEAYLAALDEADRYARSASLLTLETPPVHRVFRRWYVTALVDQLRARAQGTTPPPTPTFPQALAREVTRLASIRESADRLALLQRVTGALTRARTVQEIANALVTGTCAHLGALSSSVYLLAEDDGVLRWVASEGGETRWTDKFSEVPLDFALPGAAVFNSGEPLVLRGLGQISEQFPQIGAVYRTERTLHVAPLVVGEGRIGVVSVAFPMVAELDDRTQSSFVAALADSLAQSLERAQALERASDANEALSAANARLAFLAEASVALSGSLDYQATLAVVGRLVVPRLADWCVVSLLEDGRLRNVAVHHADPERAAWGLEIASRYPPRMDAPGGPPQVLRTGRSEVYPAFPQELLTTAAVDDEHLAVLYGMGVTSALFVPLVGRGGAMLGTVTLVHAESGRRFGEPDVPFVEDIAGRAALALEAAATYRAQTGRLATLTRVAEAAQHAILAPPPARVGAVGLAARYVSAAAEARIGGDLYEVVARPGAVRLLIGDVRGKGLTAVRMATVVLGEFRGAAADVEDLAGVAGQIDRRLRAYLGDEDFVTALLAEIRDDGRFAVASCGHPPPLLAGGDQLSVVPVESSLPLGLGASPVVTSGRMRPGDRLLLYTDGLVEARGSDGRFAGLLDLVPSLAGGEPGAVLDRILARLRTHVGPDLGDDLALLVAEYHGLP